MSLIAGDPAVLDRPILVIIPTLNEARTIAGVLDQLGADEAEADMGFVVADGGSTDATRAIVGQIAVSGSPVALLDNPAKLQSAAMNLAVAGAGANVRYLVRCDAHAAYPTGFVRAVIDAIARHDADSVVVPMDSVGQNCFGCAVAWVSDSKVGSGGSAHRGGRVSGFVDHGHHAGWRIESYRRAGGYDPAQSHNEDAEFDCRLRAGGGRIWLDGDIRLVYHPRSRPRALWRQYFNYGRGRSQTVRKHPDSLRLRQLAVPSFIGANALALLISLWWTPALLLPIAYLLLLAATSVQIALAHRSACGLLAGFAALIMHVSWACGFGWGYLTIRQPRWRAADQGV